jgi:hypothetical protein
VNLQTVEAYCITLDGNTGSVYQEAQLYRKIDRDYQGNREVQDNVQIPRFY